MENRHAWNFNEPLRKRTVIIDWLTTLWCNYRCSYCFQPEHGRHSKYIPRKRITRIINKILGKQISNHCFDNYPAKKWVENIQKIAEGRKAVLSLTGGEPFLDRKNFHYVLKSLCETEEVDNIKIDTNGSFAPEFYEDVNKEKIRLFVSFHPEYAGLEECFNKVQRIIDNGFKRWWIL